MERPAEQAATVRGYKKRRGPKGLKDKTSTKVMEQLRQYIKAEMSKITKRELEARWEHRPSYEEREYQMFERERKRDEARKKQAEAKRKAYMKEEMSKITRRERKARMGHRPSYEETLYQMHLAREREMKRLAEIEKRLRKMDEEQKRLDRKLSDDMLLKERDQYGISILTQRRVPLFRDNALTLTEVEVAPYPLINSTVDEIAGFTMNMLEEEINRLHRRYRDNHSSYMRLFFRRHEEFSSFVIRNGDREALMDKLHSSANKHYQTDDYLIDFVQLNILLSKLPTEGGCYSGRAKYTSQSIEHNRKKIKIVSYRSQNNNCLLSCFHTHYGLNANEVKYESVRKELGIPYNTKIDYELIPLISNYYNRLTKKDLGYMLQNQDQKILLFDPREDPGTVIKLFLKDDHYHLFEPIRYKRCKRCNKKLKATNKTHECNINNVSYYNTKILKKSIVRIRNIKDKQKLDYNRVIHFDVETFQPLLKHEPYLVSWYMDGEYRSVGGQECLWKFVDSVLMRQENRIISAYNGSSFDFYLLIDKLTERGIEVKDMIISNGRVMTFTFGKNNRVFDLFLFLTCSLKDSGRSFSKIEQKGEFDHGKIRSWKHVETHMKEATEYCVQDVKVLKEVFEEFNDMIYSIAHVNITRFIAMGQMAYDIWTTTLKDTVEVPKEEPKYSFIRKATYGPRCHPQRQTFKSKRYDEVMDGEMCYEELLDSRDFIFNADVNSLYPASMAGCDFMQVRYPVGVSRWSDRPERDFKDGRLGFYEIQYKPPRNLRVPILPIHGVVTTTMSSWEVPKEGGLSWTLRPGEGVYSSVDIENAIRHGYEVKFLKRALVWDESSDVFSTYVERFYKLKQQASAKRQTAKTTAMKLFLNSLYGKMLEGAHLQTTKMVYNAAQFNEFTFKNNLIYWEHFESEGKLLLAGEAKDVKDKVKKPCQLGAFILAYSRRLMLHYFEAVDPTLKSPIFTYTDTDSLRISGEDYFKLLEKGYFGDKLGYLKNDIKQDGLIIFEMNLAPKVYRYEYLDRDNEVGSKRACKGIPLVHVKDEHFQGTEDPTIRFYSMKKVLRTKAVERANDVTPFSIRGTMINRTFNKNLFNRMYKYKDQYYPIGYVDPKITIRDVAIDMGLGHLLEEDE